MSGVNISVRVFDKIQLLCKFSAKRNFSSTGSRNMRFVQFRLKNGGPQHIGAQISQDGDVFDISAVDSSMPNSLVKFLGSGDNGVLDRAKRIVAAGKSVVSLKDVDLLAPVTKMDKIACVGLNYKDHCKEQNVPEPKEPMIFSKFSSVVIGPYDSIEIPTAVSNSVDWEVELAVVIGKKAKRIREDQARDYIFGYTVAQDITARDWQKSRNNGQFLLGKSMDTFCPLGPCIVAKEYIDPSKLAIKSYVNGKLKQDSDTSNLVFKIDFLISYLSQLFTLYPGDVILTGTPGGVGAHRSPPEFLKPGDLLESEIEGIGKLINKCV